MVFNKPEQMQENVIRRMRTLRHYGTTFLETSASFKKEGLSWDLIYFCWVAASILETP